MILTKDRKITLNGLVSGEELDSAYRTRSKKYVYKKIVKQDLQSSIDEGWEKTGFRSKLHYRLKKEKRVDLGFEDVTWCIFKRMGFLEMNRDNTFVIPRYKTSDNITKQIDVFAKDEQCICIIECKSAEKPHTITSLGKDIDQISAIKHEIELSIFSHYKDPNNRKKLKTTWILATKNIDVNENDFERAKQAKIRIIDDIQYYSELSSHFGKSAKYQFLADMFPGIDIPDLIDPVPAIKGKMGDEGFYSFVMEPKSLLKIAYISHRAKTNEEAMDTYQRMARKNRLKKIAEYIHDDSGIFPTSIVITIQTDRPIRFDPATRISSERTSTLGTLYIPNKYKTAWIIDGQHRLFAYSDLDEAETASLPVIAFVNLNADRQRQLFVDINGEQKRVAKSHLIDLWDTLHWGSDNPNDRLKALTSRLIKVLDEKIGSPLRDRIIKAGNRRTETRNITMTALADEIRKRQLLGYIESRKSKEITHGHFYMYDMDSTLSRAYEVLSGYFSNYINNDDNLRKQWELGSNEGGYICTNGGLIAQIRLLKAILDQLKEKENLDIKKVPTSELLERIWKYQKPVCDFLGSAPSNIIHSYRQRYGEGGFSACTYSLMWKINDIYNDFEPQGLHQYMQSQDKKNNPEAYPLVVEIEKEMMNYILNFLKEEYGQSMSEWWHKGIPDKIRKKARNQAEDKGEFQHPEKFLYLIDWYDIIDYNFGELGEIFTINAKVNDSKKKRLKWLVEVNEIRNIVDHPPQGGVSDIQLQTLKDVHQELMSKLKEG